MRDDKPTYQDLEKQVEELKKQLEYFQSYSKTKNYENGLRSQFEENENIFKQLVENIDEVFWLRSDDEMIYINPAFEKVWGISLQEIYKNPQIFTKSIHKEDKQNILNLFQSKNFIEKGLFDYTYRIVRPDKEVRWIHAKSLPVFDNKGQIAKRVGIARDISDKIQHEQDLIEAKQVSVENELKFRLMYENTSIGIAIISLDFKIIGANKAYCAMLGYTETELVGKTLTDITHTEIIHKNIELQTQLKQGIIPSYQLEKSFIHKNGHTIYGLLNATLIKNTYNEPLYFLGNVQDITKRKQVEHELIKAKEKAEESDHLKTEFINNMSHEIRTPMNGILGFSKLLYKSNKSEEKRKQYINIIQSSGNQLMRIIDDILEISKLGTKQVKIAEKETCLNNLLLEQFTIFDIKAKENKTPLYLKKGLSDSESTILIDDTKLNKILSNLLENALKFTNVGFIEFGYQLKDSNIVLYVKDTGIGIKPESQEIIFDRFSQEEKELSKNIGGLGLGLSIAKENAELLKGKITLQSEKGKGSSFFVTIPYKPVKQKNSTINNLESGKELNKYTILIVEDEEVNYLYIETLLEDQIGINCDILHAKHGKDAIEICKQNTEISIVLMDLKMPIMNGFEAAKVIKKLRKNLTIVAQTAYTTDEDIAKAFSAGCDDYISKPIQESKLSEILKKHLIK